MAKEDDADAALLLIIDAIKGLIDRRELTSSVVSLGTIQSVVLQLSRDQEDLDQVSESTGVFAEGVNGYLGQGLGVLGAHQNTLY